VVRTPPRRAPRRRTSAPAIISVTLLVGSLLAVVVGHAMLASGEVRLASQQALLATEQANHRTMELSTAQLQIPARIVARAEQLLHMELPSNVSQLPSVPLNTAEPTPRMYRAPAPTTTTTVPPATTTTTAPTTTSTTAPTGQTTTPTTVPATNAPASGTASQSGGGA
jgi:hypothetical protein